MSAVHPQRSRHLRRLRSWPRVLRKDSAGRPSLVVETVLVVLLLTVYDKLKDLGAARRTSAIDHGFAVGVQTSRTAGEFEGREGDFHVLLQSGAGLLLLSKLPPEMANSTRSAQIV